MISAWWLIPAFVAGFLFLGLGLYNYVMGFIMTFYHLLLAVYVVIAQRIKTGEKLRVKKVFIGIALSRSFWVP